MSTTDVLFETAEVVESESMTCLPSGSVGRVEAFEFFHGDDLDRMVPCNTGGGGRAAVDAVLLWLGLALTSADRRRSILVLNS